MRHVVEHMADVCPVVPLLDDLVPQMVDTVLEFFRSLDLPVDEQVIAVPKISSSSSCPSRAALSEPQVVEQLVEVPTVLTPTRIALQIAEQIVGIPVPRGCGEQRLQGLLPGQGSTSVSSAERFSERIMEQIVDIPRGGFQGFSPGHGSTSFSSAERILSVLWSNSSTFPVEVFLLVFFRPHRLELLMRALLVVAVVWARHVLLVMLHFVLCLLTARQVLLVKVPLVVLLLAARLVLLVTMPLVCLLEVSLVLAVKGLAQDRVQQQVFLEPDAAGRVGFIESASAQAELASGGDFRFSASYLGRFFTGDDVIFSARQLPTGRWIIFRVALSLRGSSARVHCRMRPLQRV